MSQDRPCILMIDDNPGDIELMRWALDESGLQYEISSIDDGGAALDLFQRKSESRLATRPQLVILDLNLPKVNGKEILVAMRSVVQYSKVPVIVWSSSNASRDRDQLDALNVTRYVVKPTDLHEFVELGVFVKVLLDSSLTDTYIPTAEAQKDENPR